MRTGYRKALAEVGQILEYTDEEIINKIPDKFIDYIEENMDKNHKLELQDNKKLKDQNIMLETKEILALIYRDYICSAEEKKELLNDGYNNKKNREMYKINFDRRKNQNEKEEIVKGKEIQLLEKQKWYEKIIKKILDLFIRK